MKETSKKILAKEVLIFWSALLTAIVAWLLYWGTMRIIDYHENRKIIEENQLLTNSIESLEKQIDSLVKVPQFLKIPIHDKGIEEYRTSIFNYVSKREYYTNSYESFTKDYCCNIEDQNFLHRELSKFIEIGTLSVFQSKMFSDFLNPKFELARKNMESNMGKIVVLRTQKKSTNTTAVVSIIPVLIAWFILVYPIRWIFLSIKWARGTLRKEE